MIENRPTYEELENQLKFLKRELDKYRKPDSPDVDFNNEIDFHDLFDIVENFVKKDN